VDDAYISARYAENAANGWGLVYNGGEAPIEGYTNLAWTLWLTATCWLGLPVHWAMVWGGLVCGVGALAALTALTVALVDHKATWRASVPAILLAMDPHVQVVVTNGLETALYLASVPTAMVALWWAKGRWRLVAGVGCGLLAMVRPEGLIVGGVLLAFDGVERWRSAKKLETWAPWFGFLPVVLALLGWRAFTYGALVPNTGAAKMTMRYAQLKKMHINYLDDEWIYWLGALAVVCVAALLTRWTSRKMALLVVCGVSLGIASQVYLWMPGGRLLMTPVTLGVILVGVALESSKRWMGLLMFPVCVLILGVLLLPSTRRYVVLQDAHHSVVANNGAYVAAKHLGTHAPAGAWMATRDAGVLAQGVGSDVRVAELHPRALTQLHPGGADALASQYTPVDPEVFVFTVNRQGRRALMYSVERRMWLRSTAEYVYLGRVKQHYHRYYDIVVRADLDMPPLPKKILVNEALLLPERKADR